MGKLNKGLKQVCNLIFDTLHLIMDTFWSVDSCINNLKILIKIYKKKKRTSR